jgi:cystathionine gamma-synthase
MSTEDSHDQEFAYLDPQSQVVAAGRPARISDSGVNTSINLNSTFVAPGETGYGRYGNETWSALESAMELLEGGSTLIFSSGQAAIASVFSLLPRGAIIVASRNGYTGTMVSLRKLEEAGAVEVRYVDISDLPLLIERSKSLNVGVGVDNTFATPLLQRPLVMGADIVVHSLTKYIAGHSDVILGSISTTDPSLLLRLEDVRKFAGAIPGPFESWLALRGLRTLGVRMERAQANAMEIATRLNSHSAVEKVRYPGLVTDPFHERAKSFMHGFGAVISFDVKGGPDAADRTCSASRLITFATSLGGVESLWERRHRWSAESPTIPKNLIRLSVGIEALEDLWSDIDQALTASKG